MGWGIAEVAIMVNTVAICEFPPLHPVFCDDQTSFAFRYVHQRLLPETPGRD